MEMTAVEKAVFYAQQKPEVLAKIIIDLEERVTALEASAE